MTQRLWGLGADQPSYLKIIAILYTTVLKAFASFACDI